MSVTFDVSDLEDFRDELNKFKEQTDDIIIEALQEIANREWRAVKKLTPKGVYGKLVVDTYKRSNKKKGIKAGDIKKNKDGSIKMKSTSSRKGGNLRNAWKISKIVKNGDNFEVTVYNNTEYADYVEFGHRTRNHKNWVPGKFMMTISEREIDKVMEEIVNRHLEEAFSKLWLSYYKL